MKYVLNTLDECANRLDKILKKLEKNEPLGKRDINNLDWCIDKLRVTKRALEEDLKPAKPRTLDDALEYVLSKATDGTFIALLDDKKQLIRTVFVSLKILDKIPEFEVTVTPIEMSMNKIELSIPTLEFLKSIPKKAKHFIVIAKNGKSVMVVK